MFLYCFSWFWQDPMPRWAMLTARLVLKVTWVPWWRSLASKTMSSILRLELVLGEWGMRILNICWLSPYSTCLKNPFSARACPSRNTRSSTNSTSSLWHRCLLILSSFFWFLMILIKYGLSSSQIVQLLQNVTDGSESGRVSISSWWFLIKFSLC